MFTIMAAIAAFFLPDSEPSSSLEGGRKRSSSPKKTIAKKTDPELWKEAKDAACEEADLCDHSARKMQYATRWYQSEGGGYEGPKRGDNSLSVWQGQKWRTDDGTPSRGRKRYLPDEAWKSLTKAQRRRANRTKREGTKRGQQYVRNPKAAAKASRRARQRKGSRRRRKGSGRRRKGSGRQRKGSGRR